MVIPTTRLFVPITEPNQQRLRRAVQQAERRRAGTDCRTIGSGRTNFLGGEQIIRPAELADGIPAVAGWFSFLPWLGLLLWLEFGDTRPHRIKPECGVGVSLERDIGSNVLFSFF